MKSLLIINSGTHPEHIQISQSFCAEIIRRGLLCDILDMNNSVMQLHEKFYTIEKANPDWIMTLDFAGFECRSGMGDVSLNRIPCRMVHLILQVPEEGCIGAEECFNYSMYFIVSKEEYGKQLKANPSVAHIHILPELMEITSERNGAEVISMLLQQLWDIAEMSMDFTECRRL